MIQALLRKLMQPKMLILAAVLIVILNFAGFLALIGGETATQWNGNAWAYTGNPPSLSSDTVTLTASAANSQSQTGYFRTDFDISKYSEISLRYTVQASAYAGTSSAGNANFAIILDGSTAAWAGAHAEERGGTNIPSAQTSVTKIVKLKKEGGVWNVYDDVFKIGTANNLNPTLKFQVSAEGSQQGSGGTVTASVQVVYAGGPIAFNPPSLPGKPSLLSFINSLKDWLRNLFANIPFLSISGAANPVLGSTQTYRASLNAPYTLDTSYDDGTYAVRYCDVAILKGDGTVLSDAGFEDCTNAYVKDFTVQIPRTAGSYAIIAVMAESRGTYNPDIVCVQAPCQQWAFTDYQIIQKEAYDVTSKAPIPVTPVKPSLNIFASIIAWLKSLFPWW